MKRKIVSLFLCFIMIASCIMPGAAPAFAGVTSEGTVYLNGQATNFVELPDNEAVNIKVDGDKFDGLQWQIRIPKENLWANIYRENGESLTLTSALLSNVLDEEDAAYVRCAMVKSGETTYSDEIKAIISKANFETAESVATTAEQPAMMFAARPKSVENYTIRINYLFEDGTEAAQSWVGTFVAGSSYSLDVQSPKVNGYITDTTQIKKNYEEITANETFNVVYKPTNVKYAVKHFQENVLGDGYTEVTSDYVQHNDKKANDIVGAGHEKKYEGFKALDYDTTIAIAADGSTVLNIYYDRLYYLMMFDLDGGYGVEPIYAPYGAPIPSDLTPQKAGYTFSGWNKAVPATMPAENQTFKATWNAGANVNVNVVFWYENANDSNYTYVGSTKTNVGFVENKTVKPSEFKDLPFTGRDNIHFNFNSSKNTAVELKADGSTIVNVYFTRKTYRLIFFNCTIHGTNEDTNACYPGRAAGIKYVNDNNITDCVDKRYTGSGGQAWAISIYTCKWQEDVSDLWHKGIAGRQNTRRWTPYPVTGESGKVIYAGGLNVSMMNIMPDADIVFRFISEGSTTCTMNYWVTPAEGESINGKTTKKADGVTYIYHDKYTTKMGGITENEEYVDIEGFKKVYTWQQLAEKGYRTTGNGTATAHFFYKRNTYDLAFISNGETAKTVKVDYDALLNVNNNDQFKPQYPSNLEPGAYEFKGWYLSQDCVEGTEVDWSKQRMPVGGMSVYAKWEPIIHDVIVKANAGDATGTTYHATHGKTVDNPPANPTKDGYSFISWFYVDKSGVEKPFTFEMPVYSDMTLYPKWKADQIVAGTISYELKDGTKIADDSKVEALVGDTKTYDAKGGNQLYDEYAKGYFPLEISHNMEFDIDPTKNVYTFEYVKKDRVPYTVQYLEEGTNKVLAPNKHASSEYAAIVESFKPIAGYLPDLYKKTLILSANGDNVLTFWYTKDTEHAPVLRGHYLENANDNNYTTYQEVLDGYGKIGETYTESPLTEFVTTDINGFTLNVEKSTQSGILTEDGLELKLYYDRNKYPYEFRFVDQEGNEIAESITGMAKFESTVVKDAKEIPGYGLIEGEPVTKSIDSIAIEGTATKNVQVFTYEPLFADLTIQKNVDASLDANQSFLFQITGDPYNEKAEKVNLTVSIQGNGSNTIKHLPVGDYTVKEITDWSWRYVLELGQKSSKQVQLIEPKHIPYEVEFTNIRNNPYWLSGETIKSNLFKIQ
ncbi:MAG: InlB B-repeat-containing protein [Firmicutes bacterium]|nr:InlB B-repeat-containing protein [Bacillota bacterium]